MFLKFQITCACHNRYTVNESISADKIICPNCGKEYPGSAKLLDILNTAKEIPKGDLMSEEFPIRAISENEDMNTTLH
mgnify:FL=1|jgi:hypothetical protein